MKIPIPPCNNKRRTHHICRRMCCKRPKPLQPKTHQKQLIFWANGKVGEDDA